MSDSPSPLEYLLVSSKVTIESFELAHLNRAANLRKEMRSLLDEWIQAEVDSRLARCILECRRVLGDARPDVARASEEAVATGQAGVALPPVSNEPDEARTAPAGEKLARRTPAASQGMGRRASQRAETRETRTRVPANAAAAALRMLEQLARSRPGGAPLLDAERRRNSGAGARHADELPFAPVAAAAASQSDGGAREGSGEGSRPPSAARHWQRRPHPFRVPCNRGLASAS